MRIGRSRSSKVVDFGTNRKGVYDFLSVINSNIGPISHLFWVTATYWQKIANFSYTPLSFNALARGEPFRISGRTYCAKTMGDWATVWWKLHDPNFNRFCMNHLCDRGTDRQTDGRNCDSICAFSIYAVARNKIINVIVGAELGLFSTKCSKSP